MHGIRDVELICNFKNIDVLIKGSFVGYFSGLFAYSWCMVYEGFIFTLLQFIAYCIYLLIELIVSVLCLFRLLAHFIYLVNHIMCR